jgi:hypothetical protein
VPYWIPSGRVYDPRRVSKSRNSPWAGRGWWSRMRPWAAPGLRRRGVHP